MKVDEINPQGPKLFERINKLPHATCKSVVAIYHDAIRCFLPTIGNQLIERPPVFLRSADTLPTYTRTDFESIFLVVIRFLLSHLGEVPSWPTSSVAASWMLIDPFYPLVGH